MPGGRFSPYAARGRSSYRGASAAQLTCTTNLPSSQNFSMCGWATRQVDRGAYEFIACRINGTASATESASIAVSSADVFHINDFHTDNNFGTTYAIGTPFFWAIVGQAAQFTGYARRVWERALQSVNRGSAVASFTTGAFVLGNDDTTSNEWWNGDLWNVRTWSAQLTAQEMLIESLSNMPVRVKDLHAWWPLEGQGQELLSDRSGSGNHLTKVGSGTVRPFTMPAELLLPLPDDGAGDTPASASAGISSAGAAVATLATQSLASANLSSTAAASAVFASASTVPANLTSAGAASMVLATNALAKADLSSAGAASAVFTSQSSASANLSMAGSAAATLASAATASANLAMAGAATGTLASAALASVALSMAGTATAIFEASSQAQGQADLFIAGSASAVFGAQSVASANIAAAGASTAILESSSVGIASADFSAAGSASAVFGSTSTGGAVVETPAPRSQAVGGPGGGGRGKRRKRQDEELALIAEAMGEVFEKMVRGELIESEIEIDLRRTLH